MCVAINLLAELAIADEKYELARDVRHTTTFVESLVLHAVNIHAGDLLKLWH